MKEGGPVLKNGYCCFQRLGGERHKTLFIFGTIKQTSTHSQNAFHDAQLTGERIDRKTLY